MLKKIVSSIFSTRRIVAAVIMLAVTVVSAPYSSIAGASQIPVDSDAVLNGQNISVPAGTLIFPSGVSVSISETGAEAISRNQMVSYNSYGTMKDWYNTGSFVPSPYTPHGFEVAPGRNRPVFYSQTHTGYETQWFGTSRGACPITETRGVEMRCPKGTVTFTFNTPVTDPVLHINNFGGTAWDSASPNPIVNWTLFNFSVTMLTLDLENSVYSGTPNIELVSKVGNLAVVNDGAAYKLPQSESRLNGAQAITRTNDTMVHQFPWYTPGAFGSGSVVFKGTWKTITLQRNLLWFYERWNSVNNPSGSPAGNSSNQDKNKCVLDQMPAGPVHDCKLENSLWIPDTSKPNVFSAVVDKIQKQSSVPEWVTYLFSIDEDFGDAPRSYDADNGASHVLSDLRIGGIIDSVGLERALASGEVNNIGTTGIVSPNAGGTDRSDDSFVNAPDVPAAGNYSVTVPISGVSQNAKLCGWVDANASGTFDANERQCVNVSANDTSSVLAWPESFANSITSPTYMRLRLSYDVAGVESPLGRLASGEVEDWQVRRALATEAPSGSATEPPSGSAPSSPSESKTGNQVDQLPQTGGSTQMVLPSIVGLLLGGMILVSRQRRLRRSQ